MRRKKNKQISERKKTSAKTTQRQEPKENMLIAPMTGILSLFITLVAIFLSLQQSVSHQDIIPAELSPSDKKARKLPVENNSKLVKRSWDEFDGITSITDGYRVLKMVRHDPTAFTQGLQSYPETKYLVESTGLHGESLIRIWDPFSGKVMKETRLGRQYFGEGMTWYQDQEGNDRYVMITYHDKIGMVYDSNLNLLHTFKYTTRTGEGWGITFDPAKKVFFVTDGSDSIAVWSLDFKEIGRFTLTMNVQGRGKENLPQVNELEWDPSDGTILGNLWYQDFIVRILPYSGQVVQAYDLSDLYTERSESADCMNGIARYESSKPTSLTRNAWWLTGKKWPHMYLVQFLE
jgi:glutamine cyclotransferase